MTIEEYIKSLDHLKAIMGAYESIVSDFVQNEKRFTKRYFKRQMKDLQNRIKGSLKVYDAHVKTCLNDNKGKNDIDVKQLEKELEKTKKGLKDFFAKFTKKNKLTPAPDLDGTETQSPQDSSQNTDTKSQPSSPAEAEKGTTVGSAFKTKKSTVADKDKTETEKPKAEPEQTETKA